MTRAEEQGYVTRSLLAHFDSAEKPLFCLII